MIFCQTRTQHVAEVKFTRPSGRHALWPPSFAVPGQARYAAPDACRFYAARTGPESRTEYQGLMRINSAACLGRRGVHQLFRIPSLLYRYHGARVHLYIDKVCARENTFCAFSRQQNSITRTSSIVEAGLLALGALASVLFFSSFGEKLRDDQCAPA